MFFWEFASGKNRLPFGAQQKNNQSLLQQFSRKSIASIADSARFKGGFELDESYFGAKRVRGKRGRGAAGKTPVFGILKRGGRVFVTVVKDCSKSELLPIIKGQILEGSTIHTDGWKAYDGLILNGYDYYRLMSLLEEKAMSMESRLSGASQNDD